MKPAASQAEKTDRRLILVETEDGEENQGVLGEDRDEETSLAWW